MQLRIAWGGGESRQWRGKITVSEGVLSEIRCLGLEADEPGSMRALRDGVLIEQRSSRTYDGVDLLVRASLDATLSVELAAADQENELRRIDVPLSDLASGSHSSSLDAHDNRLLIRRTPGDQVRLRLDRNSLVFSPGERFDLEISPHLLDLPPNTSLRRRMQMIRVDQRGAAEELWQEDKDLHAEADRAATDRDVVQVNAPSSEGVYELVISLAERRLTDRIVPTKPLTVRKLQLVVIDPQPPAQPVVPWRQEAEIDPARPNRWRQLVQHLPGMNRDSLGVDRPRTREHLGRSLVELGPRQWRAYFLPVAKPGAPHIFEIEYPNDIPQTLGVSIFEAQRGRQSRPHRTRFRRGCAAVAGHRPSETRTAPADLLAAVRFASRAAGQSPRRRSGCVRRPSRPVRTRGVALHADCGRRGSAAAGHLFRQAVVPGELLGQRVAGPSDRPQLGRLGYVLRRRPPAGRIRQPRRVQRRGALRGLRRQRYLPQRVARPHPEVRHRRVLHDGAGPPAERRPGDALPAVRPPPPQTGAGLAVLQSFARAGVVAG